MNSLHFPTKQDKNFVIFYPNEQTNAIKILKNTSQCLSKELQEKTAGYKLISRGYLKRIISILEDPTMYHAQLVDLYDDKDYNLFRDVRFYINQSKCRITGKELSEFFNYNYEYIATVFKKYSGQTITEYSHHHLLELACKLLAESDASIVQITEELGFTNRTYFNKLFKNAYGMTPLSYRRRAINIRANI